MNLMLLEPAKYSCKIVIIPDISRGIEHMIEQYKNTKAFFVNKYGQEYVVDGYDINNNKFIDASEYFDIIYFANPYDSMVNELHSIKYLSQKNILPIYLSYGCYVDKYSYQEVMPLLELSLCWKIFADNKYTFNDYKNYELIHGKNVILSGYAKMDSLIKYQKNTTDKKIIIIAPHHTISMQLLPLSNFLHNYNFIIELAKKYPQVQFIFRPHPLLFTNMVNEGYWTKDQVNQYIKKLQSLGMIYSVGGDYLDIFVQSDAIIHDCSSFIVEYLYTNKPCCFFAKKNYKNILSTLGKKCLKHYYIAFNQDQICTFIDHVINNKTDILAKKREIFVRKKLAVSYPNSSQKILDEIYIQ